MSALGRRISKLRQILRTLRHVQPKQAVAQLEHVVVGLKPPRPWTGGTPEIAAGVPAVPFPGAPAHAGLEPGRTLRLLNREVDIAGGIDWDFKGEGPLFAYHLHQHDYLRPGALGGDGAQAPRARAEVMLDWVARHARGVGWDPHPISVRSFAWTRLALTHGLVEISPDERERLLISWAQQIDTLDRNIEVRLQANHLLSNLMAVVLGGLVLDADASPDWLARWTWLEDEMGRQILADGAHEERSPMYHSLLLENVLDMLNVARVCPGRGATSLHQTLESAAARMLGALDIWTHPDGQIALFSDSAFGIAAAPEQLHAYAAALGVEPRPPSKPGVLDRGGYVRLEAGPWSVLTSVAGPQPAHQPGHAHCDALALELCLGQTRVLCDTGVYEYVPGERRQIARATRSHATIEIGGHEQAEVWAPHRIGGRPEVELTRARPPHHCEATCVGWATPLARHIRRVEVEPRSVTITDQVQSIGSTAALIVWPFGPDIEVDLSPGRARLTLPTGQHVEMLLPEHVEWRLERAPYYPEFGQELERPVLIGEAEAPFEITTTFRTPD